MALDRQFALVTDAVAAKLGPLEKQAQALVADHVEKLAALKQLKAAKDGRTRRQLERLAAEEPHTSTWRKASEPLRIELTTIGTTVALVVGMIVANVAHGRQGRTQSGEQAASATALAVGESLGLTAASSKGSIMRPYGAFQ
jgi:malonyl CoA-acyl carrier protein transacylase